MQKELPPILMQLKVAKNGDIMVKTWIPKVQVNE
jgi:hypothetical protein